MADSQNQYELERIERMANNKRKMEELGILAARAELDKLTAVPARPSKARARKVKLVGPECPELRRSSRERTKVNYCEEGSSFNHRLPGPKGERRVVFMNREDLDIDIIGCPKVRSNVDSGKGVRIQGGRVYDSKHGVTCHWCRQKTLEDKVTCTDPGCGGCRRLPTSFCKMCLRNRHGEDVRQAEASGKWVCPGCRVSCGEGCSLCCNCGPCRKKAGLTPTHQIIREARESGFSNVHDYLVHQATGESAEAIAERKITAAWGMWLTEEPSAEAASGGQTDEARTEDSAVNGQAEGPSEAADSDDEDEPPAADEMAVKQTVQPETEKSVQQAITDSFTVVKAVHAVAAGKASESASARRAERKLRVLRSMGLAPLAAQVKCN